MGDTDIASMLTGAACLPPYIYCRIPYRAYAMTIRTGDDTHIITRQRSVMKHLASTDPLRLILLAQAAISIIALRNTAFLDEASYIYAGEQLLQGKATVGHYATYFSGYPDFYPAIAGLLNLVGGLELVRLFSTACMLFVTSCVFLVTERLYNRTSAYAAAALFAFTGPTLFLSHLAT